MSSRTMTGTCSVYHMHTWYDAHLVSTEVVHSGTFYDVVLPDGKQVSVESSNINIPKAVIQANMTQETPYERTERLLRAFINKEA